MNQIVLAIYFIKTNILPEI